VSRSVAAALLLLLACGRDRPTTRPDAGVRGRRMRSTGGYLLHEGSIGKGQSVAYAQALESGYMDACVQGLKPSTQAFRGHLEVDAPDSTGSFRNRLRMSDWYLQAGLYQWQNWCEYLGYVRQGELVRLVSDAEGAGTFKFEVTLRVP